MMRAKKWQIYENGIIVLGKNNCLKYLKYNIKCNAKKVFYNYL